MVPTPKLRSRGSSDGRGVATWTEVAVIGSGPGGAVTACLLSESGREVTLIEEGRDLAADRPRQFSIGEMAEKYRNGGVTALLGNPKIAYVEGRCVGGGSEINSGLYHRTPPEALERWRTEFLVQDLDEQTLRPHFEQCERDVCVSLLPCDAPAASRRLDAGARQLGWKSLEVPRWISFGAARDAGDRSAGPAGLRQTMSRTYIPRALAAGCQLIAETRVTRLRRLPRGWAIEMIDSSGRESRLNAETVFVACGAIHSPALLQRSGLGSNAGRSLHVHPTVKLVAEFEEQVNGWNSGVGVHQVKEFSPRLGFGCSVASPPHLGLAMLDHPRETRRLEDSWPNMAVYYAMTTGGRGSVRALPGFRDPLVRFRLAEPEMRDLADGLWKLSEALFAAGATTLFPAVRGAAAVRGRRELSQIPALLSRGAANLMTIHLFSTCPMGEDRRRCTADSYGKVHGEQNLYLADASLLCTAPGVNPQGSIMAIARRNALHFLANS
ncbi:MAG: GMC family oxidoreductase [Planctomycetia bacterium]|nr:GMC family oxidoreductase [Planctomycetia bacterium]